MITAVVNIRFKPLNSRAIDSIGRQSDIMVESVECRRHIKLSEDSATGIVSLDSKFDEITVSTVSVDFVGV